MGSEYLYERLAPPAKDPNSKCLSSDELTEIRAATYDDNVYHQTIHFNDPELLAMDPPNLIDSKVTDFAIWAKGPNDNAKDTLIGELCSYHYVPGVSIEIGITIWNRAFWGRGYGTSAINQFVRAIFAKTDVTAIRLKTVEGNIRAYRCYMKCGFTPYGYYVSDGFKYILMHKEKEA